MPHASTRLAGILAIGLTVSSPTVTRAQSQAVSELPAEAAGLPAEAVTSAKERSLTLAALHFLHRHRALDVRSRFDIVSIVWPDSSRRPTIEHIANAFEAVGYGQMFR